MELQDMNYAYPKTFYLMGLQETEYTYPNIAFGSLLLLLLSHIYSVMNIYKKKMIITNKLRYKL